MVAEEGAISLESRKPDLAAWSMGRGFVYTGVSRKTGLRGASGGEWRSYDRDLD